MQDIKEKIIHHICEDMKKKNLNFYGTYNVTNIIYDKFYVIDVDLLKTIKVEELKENIDSCISAKCPQSIKTNINEIKGEIGECAICLIDRIIKKYKLIERDI